MFISFDPEGKQREDKGLQQPVLFPEIPQLLLVSEHPTTHNRGRGIFKTCEFNCEPNGLQEEIEGNYNFEGTVYKRKEREKKKEKKRGQCPLTPGLRCPPPPL